MADDLKLAWGNIHDGVHFHSSVEIKKSGIQFTFINNILQSVYIEIRSINISKYYPYLCIGNTVLRSNDEISNSVL